MFACKILRTGNQLTIQGTTKSSVSFKTKLKILLDIILPIIVFILLLFREEHKRLSPNCPFVKLGKSQKDCTVKEILEICQKGLLKLVVSIKTNLNIYIHLLSFSSAFQDKAAASKVDEYNTQARKVREGLEQLGTQMNLNSH